MQFGPNNRKALALIGLVFVLGVAIGAVGHSVADRRVLGARTQTQTQAPGFLQPRPNPPRAVAHLTTELNLTPDQQTKVQSALQSEDPQIQRALQDSSIARENCRTKMRDIRAATDSQIREMLDSNQQKQWDEMQTRRGERTQHRGSAAPDSNSIQQQPAR